MIVIQIILVVLVDLLISAAFLWIGMKVASFYAGMRSGAQYCSYADLIKVCFVASLVALIPYVGWIASWIILFYMLKKVTEAEVVELIIMVVVSRLAALFFVPLLIAL